MTDINKAAAALFAAKTAEDAARRNRVKCEENLVLLTGAKQEGRQSHDAGDYSVTVTGKMTRALDIGKWEKIKDSIPEKMRPVTYKPALDLSGVRYLQNNEPEVYALFSQAMTVKPAKTSVTIKQKEQE
jgi:hypothetical protein